MTVSITVLFHDMNLLMQHSLEDCIPYTGFLRSTALSRKRRLSAIIRRSTVGGIFISHAGKLYYEVMEQRLRHFLEDVLGISATDLMFLIKVVLERVGNGVKRE